MTTGKKDDVDLLSQIYREMNETGKEKLKQVAAQILKIWNIVKDGNPVSVNAAVNFEFENK